MKLSKAGLIGVLGVVFAVILGGCSPIFDFTLRHTVDPDAGSATLSGPAEKVVVLRDELGIPVIEAQNFHDLAFATGYVMASDRLAQMETFSLLGQGRLAEMVGEIGLDIDIYVRTLGIADAARKEYAQLDGEIKEGLDAFSDGVNAYIKTHADRLPLDFRLTGYTPPPWEPIDALYIANALNMGLSFNLLEEIEFLNIAKAIGPKKAAWLIPVYPDEPLPFEKAEVLSKLDFNGLGHAAESLAALHLKIDQALMPLGIPASNNWGIAPQKTKMGASIIANDTHLPLEQPPIWMLIHMKCPEFDAAGIAIAGVPGIVAGYNTHIAWGETMVMADNQDVFIERLKRENGKTYYLYKDKWYPVTQRREVFKIKGAKDVTRTISYTRHGPLLNDALQHQPKHFAIPPKITTRYGLALRSVLSDPGHAFEGMFRLNRATDMESARDAISQIRSMSLNFIYGDPSHIAWQVSGIYPKRKAGRGHLPSPGWTGDYDWQGFVDVEKHPYRMDPEDGFLYTANNRTLPPDAGPILSSSWYSPERAERIGQMLAECRAHTWKETVAMQNDRHDLSAMKLKRVLYDSPLSDDIQRSIRSLGNDKRAKDAAEALEIFRSFDGNMNPDSKGASITGIFRDVFIRDVFLDELGPEDGPVWKSFASMIQAIYSADQDHLLGRQQSPFWDNIQTPEKETKADTIAAALADSILEAEDILGRDRGNWKWKRLLRYRWRTQMTQMRSFMPWWKRFAVSIIGRYADRGPYPAGGDYNTLNVAGFHKGKDFDVWLIPAMRLVVDFGLDEPMFLINSGGQSGNPASPHYDDGIPVWLNGEARHMPFRKTNIEKQYQRVYTLIPAVR